MLLFSACNGCNPQIKPVDIPAGFGYPGSRSEFQEWADTWQIENIDTSAWNLWAGMTSESGQTWNGSRLPVWETWCGQEEVFSTNGCRALERPARAFQHASQIGHTMDESLVDGAAMNNSRVVSFNKFNPAMAEYLAAAHPGPGGARYSYISMQDLASLNTAWPSETPISSRVVAEAPYQPDNGDTIGFSAIETKPVIFLAKASGLTPIPLWQGTANSTTPTNASPNTWFTCVLVDPDGSADPSTLPVPATTEQIRQAVSSSGLACKTENYKYAPLSTIYSFQMDAKEASDWNALQDESGDGGQGLTAEAGDCGVLVGMHVNTKTIVNWTWQTFWWQPGQDAPDDFPGDKHDMTGNVVGAWRNYAMCTAWNQTKGNRSDDMVVCFNPYLETSVGIPAGQTSNCMSCHGTATVGSPLGPGTPPTLPTLNYPTAYEAPIDFGIDPRFATFTRTDFSWAIPQDAISVQ